MINEHVPVLTLLILQGGGSMPVTILEFRHWKENEIENASILVDLIQDTKKEDMAYPDGRILILSRFHIHIVYIRLNSKNCDLHHLRFLTF